MTAQNALPLTAKFRQLSPPHRAATKLGAEHDALVDIFFVFVFAFGRTHNFQLSLFFFSHPILIFANGSRATATCLPAHSRISQRRRHDIQLHQRGAHQRQQNQDEKEAFYRTESQAVPCERAHSQRVNVGCQPHGECNVGRRRRRRRSLSGLFMLLF